MRFTNLTKILLSFYKASGNSKYLKRFVELFDLKKASKTDFQNLHGYRIRL